MRAVSLLGAALALLLPGVGAALEKASHPAPGPPTWSCSLDAAVISYYNSCNGWIWAWSGWEPESRFGTVFGEGDLFCFLEKSTLYVASGAGSGYGFTGTVNVRDFDANDCPTGPVIASQPFQPTPGWHVFDWGGVLTSGRLLLEVVNGPSANNPVAYGSDHPAAGPGPPTVQACGVCFPSTRISRSYVWGTPGSPTCPGTSLEDATGCPVEWLALACLPYVPDYHCFTGVEQSTWGRVKALYR